MARPITTLAIATAMLLAAPQVASALDRVQPENRVRGQTELDHVGVGAQRELSPGRHRGKADAGTTIASGCLRAPRVAPWRAATRSGGMLLETHGFKITGQLRTIWDSPRLFTNWLRGNQSLGRLGNPLSHVEANQLVINARRLGLRLDLNRAGLQGLERTGQWAGVPHFKIGNVHIPVAPGFTP